MRQIRIKGWKKGNQDIKDAFAGDEILLKDLFMIFWERRLMIVGMVLLFWIIAIVKIATTPYSYSCTSTYITEQSTQGNDLQGGVAQLFGLSGPELGGGSGTFSDPGFYPSIVSSQPFLRDLMSESFFFTTLKEEMTLEEFTNRYDSRNMVSRWLGPVMSIPGRIIRSLEKKPEELSESAIASVTTADSVKEVSPILNLSKAQINAMKNVSNRIDISASGNIIQVDTRMPDPLVCALMNQKVSENLLNFIISKETEKERRDLAYVERRVQTAKINFEKSQRALAKFRDSNRGVVSAEAETAEERLQSEYSIYLGIYQRLATELEEKRIALEEKTPIFSVFEPVYVPRDPDSRGSFRTLIIYTILGIFLGVVILGIILVRTLMTMS